MVYAVAKTKWAEFREGDNILKKSDANKNSLVPKAGTHPLNPDFLGSPATRFRVDEFLTSLTHELRTPMIGILGSADLLEHSSLNNSQQLLVDDIKGCGDMLLNNIDYMLELLKLDYGLVELNQSPVNLYDLIQKSVAAIEETFRNQGLSVEISLDSSLQVCATLDPSLLLRIINGLLTDNLNYASRNSVRLSARTDASAATQQLFINISSISSTDADCSTIKHCVPSQSPSTSLNEVNLLRSALCTQLAELMGGQIHIRSHANAGAITELIIPFEPVEHPLIEPTSISNVNWNLDDEFAASFVPVSILLVDDNEMNQKLIGQMLTNYGFEVITANDGLQALNSLQRKHFDLVLMDMQMPRMDGYETTRLIRANQSWSKMPIIAITANSLNSDRDKCLKYGCDSYLAKPFKSETLVREIKRLIRNDFIKDKNADIFSQQLINDLLPEFLEMLDEMVNELELAIRMKDEAQIKSISHNIKGTAGMYGFMQISQLAANIQKSAGDKNYNLLSALCQQIIGLARESHSQVINKVII